MHDGNATKKRLPGAKAGKYGAKQGRKGLYRRAGSSKSAGQSVRNCIKIQLLNFRKHLPFSLDRRLARPLSRSLPHVRCTHFCCATRAPACRPVCPEAGMSPWMLALLCATPLLFIAAMFWPRWRMRRALRAPFPAAHRALLAKAVPGWHNMAPETQRELRRLTREFLHQKKFIGCAGLEVTDEMRITIAGLACMLILKRERDVYPALTHVLIYPGLFAVPRTARDDAGVVTQERQALAGESWSDGRVILAWDHVQQALQDPSAHNVVWHEFAHQLDSEAGPTNGAPLLPGARAYRTWSELMQSEFAQLRQAAYWGQPTLLDYYGASNPAEFFAVATETFFGRPYQMAARHGELFALLQAYYRVDPRHWMEQPAAQEEELRGYFSVH